MINKLSSIAPHSDNNNNVDGNVSNWWFKDQETCIIKKLKEVIMKPSSKPSSNCNNNVDKNVNWYYYLSIAIGLLNVLFFPRAYVNDHQGLEFYNDIQKHEKQITLALLLSFGSALTLMTDIVGDTTSKGIYLSSKYFRSSKSSKSTSPLFLDLTERFIIISYTLISNSFFWMTLKSKYVERSFMFFHCLQHLGYITVIHALCVKLEPRYFAKKIFMVALLLLLCASVFLVEAAGYEEEYNFFNVLGVSLTIISFSIFIYKWYFWLYGLSLNTNAITVTDIRLALYLIVTSVVLMLVTMVPGILISSSFKKMRSDEACWLIYINFIFNVLFGSLPSRIISYVATVNNDCALESKKNLVRFLCHELRSPLNVAKIGISLINRSKDTDVIEDIESEIDAAISLLNNLLESEKLDEAKLNLVATYCHFSFIDKTLKKYALLAKQKDILYEICNNDDMMDVMLYVDKYKIDQIIRNLVSNAIKFTPAGGLISIMVSISKKMLPDLSNLCPRFTGSFLCVEIKDTGVGVSVEQQCKIFQQFQQLSSTSFGGSGLGLFISKEIAELHNGSLDFSSDGEGKGSCFKLQLPLFESDVLPIEVDNKINEETKNADIIANFDNNSQLNINILVCDDSSLNRKYLIRTLKVLLSNKFSHVNPDFQEVDDGETMIQYLKNNSNAHPDILFVDNIMIRMNGPQATKIARSMGFQNVIVGVSGNMMADDVREFYDAGCTSFLGKPVDMIKLEKIFTDLVRKCNQANQIV